MDGTVRDETLFERALIKLIRKNFDQPARLVPVDLDPLREIVGDGALDYTLVIGLFHFINRIADLLHVAPEALPESLRRFGFLRRMTVRIASLIMSRMDLKNRKFGSSYEETLENITPLFEQTMDRKPGDAFAPVKTRPKLIEVFQFILEEQVIHTSLNRETLADIHRTVEDALPAAIDDAKGFHARPENPVEAFAFVGTRYAYRTTENMIDELRRMNYDDVGILDLAIAVAIANFWARTHRLLSLEPELFYVGSREALIIRTRSVNDMFLQYTPSAAQL